MSDLAEVRAESAGTTIGRALGEELRSLREARGLSRAEFVLGLPSGIGERTLLSYEHGTRQLTVSRLLELAARLEVDPAVVVTRGLQRARLYLDQITLHVDLRAMLKDLGSGSRLFPSMVPWAHNALIANPDGLVEVDTKVVHHLALFAGCSRRELIGYLARFIPLPDELDTDAKEDIDRPV